MSVKRRLTPKRERETPEYAAMVRRVIRAHGRRVIHADPEDLAELVALRAVVDQAITDAVRGMRAEHGSWSDIGRGLGTSRQAAQMRYGAPETSGEPTARARLGRQHKGRRRTARRGLDAMPRGRQ